MPYIKKWSENIEEILIQQQNKCAAYKWLHEADCNILSKRNKFLSITTIMIVSFSATVSTITADIGNKESKLIMYIQIIYPIFLYLSAIISSLQQFLNYEKEAEKHRTSSIRYTALYNNIKRMLTLEPEQRQHVYNYFTWVNKEYDNIFTSSPSILSSTVNIFEKKFKTDFSSLKNDIENNDKIFENEAEESHSEIIIMNEIENSTPIETETERLKYELDRFMINSYNC